MTPLEIIKEGQIVRSALIRQDCTAIRLEYSPGNMTLYDLTFTAASGTGLLSTDRRIMRQQRHADVAVAKTNGTPRWATVLPLLELETPFYADPGYLMQDLGLRSWGDIIPVGLLISAVGGCPTGDLMGSPYVDPDDPERLRPADTFL